MSSPAPPPPSSAADWRCVHVGFNHDGFLLDGIDIWQQPWRPAGQPPVLLPHPAHPDQTHRYDIHDCGEGAAGTRFAAAELSNGVWGFYVRAERRVESSGLTPDGTLRYEQRPGEDRGDGRLDGVSAAVLVDVASGRPLVDCAAWPSSRIVPDARGHLYLRLAQNGFEAMFAIDPTRRSFRDVGEAGPERPLADLARAVEQARTPGGGAPTYRRIAPDGSIRVDLQTAEWSNSHWVAAPRVIEIATGRVLLDLWDSDWDATVSFPPDGRVRLDMRRYHVGGDLEVELDPANGRYRIVREYGREEPQPDAPIAGVAEGMEVASRRSAEAIRLALGRPVPVAPPHPLAAWRLALLILLVALVTIAAATILSLYVFPEEQASPPLDRIPVFRPRG